MAMLTDIAVRAVEIFFLPVHTRVPLKFGNEVLTSVTCVRVKVTVENKHGRIAEGWGETPLSVQWVWPETIPYSFRYSKLKDFVLELARDFPDYPLEGHPIEIGHDFQRIFLPKILERFNLTTEKSKHMPWLAALVAFSPFDIALHDAYGVVNEISVYETYNNEYMNRDLSSYLEAAETEFFTFNNMYPENFFTYPKAKQLIAWHLVGGLDAIDEPSSTENNIIDNYPVSLRNWIRHDGLECLKIKLKGTDAHWDFERIVKVGAIAIEEDVKWLSTDFNCTVTDPGYVNNILDRLAEDYPLIFNMILYIEQPFPYDLDSNRIDVHSVSIRKPLFMDESAHNWEMIRLGRELGWTGVALKTCKTQSEALLCLSWAKAHKMPVMVQDLTNPMLAQIPHVLLAAHSGTIMGVETNSMQFYPDASLPEAKIHPGIYTRRKGVLDLSTIKGPGFGYRINEIKRTLPLKECMKE